MMERTLVIVKPDGVYRALIGKIVAKIEDAGLKVVGLKMVRPNEEMAGKHYIADEEWLVSVGKKSLSSYKEKGIEVNATEKEIGNKIRGYLIKYFTSGPVVAMAVEGNDAIFVTRKLVGSTEPKKADPSSIRGEYASDAYDLADSKMRAIKNLVHVSDEPKNAEREIKLWFKDSELLDYKRADEDILYE